MYYARPNRSALLILAVLTAALAACDKKSPTDENGNGSGTYFYRFDANGTRVTFNQQVTLNATFSQSSNQRVAIITGYDATRNSAVQIYSGSNITTATYTGYTVDLNAGAVVGMIFHYQDATGAVYQSDNTNSNTATLTQINATTVRGTFSGRLKAVGKADLVITNGEFFVQRIN